VRENYLELKNSIIEEVKQAFDLAGIEIPFPQRTLHLAQQSHPVTGEFGDSTGE
jgi:small-conductance mechanosensitive channel